MSAWQGSIMLITSMIKNELDDTKFCYQSVRLFFYLNHKKFWEFFGSSERKPFKRECDDAYCPMT